MEGTSFQLAIPSFTSLSILDFNARSCLPKFDELAATAKALQPTAISIVETWVSEQVTESEILWVMSLIDWIAAGMVEELLYMSAELLTGPHNLEFVSFLSLLKL